MAPLSVSSVQRHKDFEELNSNAKARNPNCVDFSIMNHESICVDCTSSLSIVVSVQVSEWRDHGGRKVPERHRGMDKNK